MVLVLGPCAHVGDLGEIFVFSLAQPGLSQPAGKSTNELCVCVTLRYGLTSKTTAPVSEHPGPPLQVPQMQTWEAARWWLK